MLELDLSLLNLIVGSLVPLVVALVTKSGAASWVKSITMFALACVSGVATYMIEHSGAIRWENVVGVCVATYLAAGVTYQNLWKPTGTAQAVANIAPETGIGAGSGASPA